MHMFLHSWVFCTAVAKSIYYQTKAAMMEVHNVILLLTDKHSCYTLYDISVCGVDKIQFFSLKSSFAHLNKS